jgi:hypothetical protein
MSTPSVPAGWYVDPADSSQERFWDGSGWTDESRPFGTPPTPPPAPAAAHPAGWYPDAHGAMRWWDGEDWTDDVAPPPAPPAPRTTARRPPAFWCAIAGAALMVAGGLGPWATTLRVVDVSGTEGDGVLVIGAALLALAVLVVSPRDAAPVVALLAGIGGAIVGFVDLADINSRGSFARPAWGIYMVLLSSGTLFVSSIVLLLQRRT